MNDDKNSGQELNRQIWEPAGVISVMNENKGMNYGHRSKETKKGGQITLEVEEVFHNKAVMGNLPENTPTDERFDLNRSSASENYNENFSFYNVDRGGSLLHNKKKIHRVNDRGAVD